jgi:hypothetical protein
MIPRIPYAHQLGTVWDPAALPKPAPGLPERADPGGHTNYGWPLSDIEPLDPPVPARGDRAFWMWTMETP